MSETYFQKGFGLKSEVGPILARTYRSPVIERLKALGYEANAGGIHFKLAKEFGFCYGVDRAVDYAYQTRQRFADRRVFLSGEIIHNPDVNTRLREMGICILDDSRDPVARFREVGAGDVVILPAFGVSVPELQHLQEKQCVLVDTTCGSVLNVWKKVHYYARDGYTVVIHGKHYHEETRATASQVGRHPGGHYLVVRDMSEARLVCDYIEASGTREEFMTRFARAASPGFDPDLHLRRIGVANQTTMLARESLAIGEEVGRAVARRYGDEYRAENFRTFDTICSATQDRQDAVQELLRESLDAMVVIGGYNSSNTISLAALCAERVPTYHIEDATSIEPETRRIIFRPAGVKHSEASAVDWIPDHSGVRIGLTAGASTPNNKIGETVARIFATRGIDVRIVDAA